MRVNVLIATHERRELLRRTLRSLAEAEHPPALENVWVIENGPGDVSREVCASFSEVLPLRYEHQVQPGKSRALQSILTRLQGDFAVFLDDDVRVSPDLLVRYAGAVDAHGRGHFFGGPLEIDYASPPPAWLEPHLPASVKGWTPEEPVDTDSIDAFLGANFGAFVDELLAVGGFDPELGPGAMQAGTEGNPTGQERDAQLRLRDAGKQPVFVPGAVVWHFVPEDRCTPTWVLQRRRRNAMTTVLKKHEEWSAAWWIGGVPSWVWKTYLLSLATYAASTLLPEGPRRLNWRLRTYRSRGWIDGFRLLAQRNPGSRPRLLARAHPYVKAD